eukprot:g8288.t1
MNCILKVVVAVLLVVGHFAEASQKKKNFIFYQPDELRADALGVYGNKISKTPNFDAFAEEATRFDQAHVSYTVCTQSRVAFMTGWPTHVRGHRTLWSLLHKWEPNLLKYFKQNNYTVKWWGKNDLLAHDSFPDSVTSAIQSKGQDNGKNPYDLSDPRHYSFLYEAYEGSFNTTKDYCNVAEAINFLNSRPKEPFFIFLPLTKPHPPYSVPEPFYSSIDVKDVPDLRPHSLPNKPDYHKLIRQYRNITSLDDAFFKKIHAVYLGSVSYSDFLFGLLLAAVKENGFDDSTTVSVFADHGDYAGDYGLVEKWPSGLEDVLTRVPLLIRTPGGARGHIVDEPVQLFDIVPTMLEIANISLAHVQFGKSLLPQLHGATGDPTWAVYSEGGYATSEPRDFEGNPAVGGIGKKKSIYYPKALQQIERPLSVCRSTSVRTLTHKLVFRSDPQSEDHCSELYELQSDPKELKNLYNDPAYSLIQAQLKEKLFLWYMQTSDVTPWAIDPRSGGMPYPSTGRQLPIDISEDTPTDSSVPVMYFTT